MNWLVFQNTDSNPPPQQRYKSRWGRHLLQWSRVVAGNQTRVTWFVFYDGTVVLLNYGRRTSGTEVMLLDSCLMCNPTSVWVMRQWRIIVNIPTLMPSLYNYKTTTSHQKPIVIEYSTDCLAVLTMTMDQVKITFPQ